MIKFIDFYFDFISPYSFLAYKKIKLLKDININYKPILLGGLHKLGGITAPAFNERKMKNMKNDCEIIAKKNDIQFIWNNKFPLNSLSLINLLFSKSDKTTSIKLFTSCFFTLVFEFFRYFFNKYVLSCCLEGAYFST